MFNNQIIALKNIFIDSKVSAEARVLFSASKESELAIGSVFEWSNFDVKFLFPRTMQLFISLISRFYISPFKDNSSFNTASVSMSLPRSMTLACRTIFVKGLL